MVWMVDDEFILHAKPIIATTYETAKALCAKQRATDKMSQKPIKPVVIT